MDSPDTHTRLIIATNRYDVFDIESFGDELGLLVLGLEDELGLVE